MGDDGAHERFLLLQTTGVSKRAAGEMRLEIVANQLSHRLAGLDRAARLMRLDDNLPKAMRRGSMSGSFQNTSSAAPAMRVARKRVDQGRFVDDRAARDVDEEAGGTEGLEHGGVDEAARRLAAGDGGDKNVACARRVRPGSGDRRGRVGRRRDIAIGELHAKTLGAPRDGAADAAEAENAERLAVQARAERQRAALHAPERTCASPATTLRSGRE